jgi:exosome complex component RRP41
MSKHTHPYPKRVDGRGWDDLRPIEAKAGVIPQADGSAMFKIGNSTAYAAVYGPKELHPKFMQNPNTGILRCNYNMQPFSGPGNRSKPGPSRRSKEISMVMQKAIEPVVDLSDYPNTVVDVFVEFVETDAGSRCAAICAAAIALADAGITMKDMVAAVAVGHVEEQILVDLNGEEEHLKMEVADIPCAIIPSTGEITLLQMDGITSKETLLAAIEKAKGAVVKITEIQKQALLDKYRG